MKLVDMHLHILYSVDDGAKTKEEMLRMAESAYRDGVRVMCVTPHFHKGFFGDNTEAARTAFDELCEYAASKLPDLRLCRGSELRYSPEYAEWIGSGECFTINGTQYLLVDFLYDESEYTIVRAMHNILNSGYVPILAHTERYEKIRTNLNTLESLKKAGVVFQLDADGLIGVDGFFEKRAAHNLIRHKIADMVASDAHGTDRRPNQLRKAYRLIEKNYQKETADILFWENPMAVIEGKTILKQSRGN